MWGNFAFGGEQRSASEICFHADAIPTSLTAVQLPFISCHSLMLQNDPDSTGNVTIGSSRTGIVGYGIVLEPGKVSGWIPVSSLSNIWHKEEDATTVLRYLAMLSCEEFNAVPFHILLENGAFLLQENGGKLYI